MGDGRMQELDRGAGTPWLFSSRTSRSRQAFLIATVFKVVDSPEPATTPVRPCDVLTAAVPYLYSPLGGLNIRTYSGRLR